MQKTSGFSLIEAVVSITLLIVAVTGPLALSARSLRASQEVKYEIEAVHLAEEGLEIVRNIRDNNSTQNTDVALNPQDWWSAPVMDLSECDVAYGCFLDLTIHTPGNVWSATTLKKCTTFDCGGKIRVYKNKATGLYRQASGGLGGAAWELSPYTRRVTVGVVDNEKYLRATSTVSYVGIGGATRTVSLTMDLYNWFPCTLTSCL